MSSSPRAVRIGGGLIVLLLWLQLGASLPAVHEVRRNDFPAYWAAGKMVLEGQPEAVIAFFALGTWWAGGQEVQENAWYAARETETRFRWQLNLQPLGALLLVAACAVPLAEMAHRQQSSERG